MQRDYGTRFLTGPAFSPDGKAGAVTSDVWNENGSSVVAAEVDLFDARRVAGRG